MAEDAYGNYYPDLKDNNDWVPPLNGASVGIGAGAPTATTAITLLYIDSNTGLLYSNPTQVAGAWVALGAGSGGGKAGVGSPQGVVTAAAGTTYLDTATGNFWANQDGTIGNWIELIG